MNISIKLKFAYYYVLGLVLEYFGSLYLYLMLCLPIYMFPAYVETTIKVIEYSSDSDSDETKEDVETTERIIVFDTEFTFNKPRLDKQPSTDNYYIEIMAPTQLLMFANDYGQISINDLLKYYPNLAMVSISYSKQNGNVSGDHVIDIAKRFNVETGKKCAFGRIQL